MDSAGQEKSAANPDQMVMYGRQHYPEAIAMDISPSGLPLNPQSPSHQQQQPYYSGPSDAQVVIPALASHQLQQYSGPTHPNVLAQSSPSHQQQHFVGTTGGAQQTLVSPCSPQQQQYYSGPIGGAQVLVQPHSSQQQHFVGTTGGTHVLVPISSPHGHHPDLRENKECECCYPVSHCLCVNWRKVDFCSLVGNPVEVIEDNKENFYLVKTSRIDLSPKSYIQRNQNNAVHSVNIV